MAQRDSAVRAGKAAGGLRQGARPVADSYFSRSQRPLEIFSFLLPLIVFYEVGLVFVLRSGNAVITNKAHEAIVRVFEVFGLDGERLSLPALCLPGILLIAVLLASQLLARAAWTVDLRTVLLMAVESIVLAVPIFLAVQLMALAFARVAPTAAVALDESLRSLSPMGRIAVAIGAGIYEELIFRMALILFLHTVFVDAFKWKERRAIALAVVISAIAFVFYHPLRDAHNHIEWRRVIALGLLGLWFGAVYAKRGFGIVVGTHAVYDVMALMLE